MLRYKQKTTNIFLGSSYFNPDSYDTRLTLISFKITIVLPLYSTVGYKVIVGNNRR